MISTLGRQIAEIIGAEHVIDEPAACAAHAVHGAAPALVAAPASVEELAQVVAAAAAAGLAVAPYGGGTMQSWGRPLSAAGFVALRTARLDRVLIYEPDDLTISVEAGMALASLDAALAANGQMLPLDAPRRERSTIGGILATAMDGPRRLGYGTARDLLIGIRVVEAGGRISKAGGMVVKNVSGFDMMKLYLGSLGSLAIIVSANFKLLPQARAAASVLASFPTPAAALACADAIGASQLTPVAVEYLYGQQLGAGAPTLLVWAEGLPAAVERHVRDVEALAARAGALEARQLRGDDHRAVWATATDLAASDDTAATELALRLACLPAELARALGDAGAAAQRHGLALQVVARALSGVAYLRLAGPAEGLRAAHAALLAAWPHLAVLAGPPALTAELTVWGAPPANLELMRRIKHEFDPQGQLNPGRYAV